MISFYINFLSMIYARKVHIEKRGLFRKFI